MSLAVISINTETQTFSLTLNGAPIEADEVHFEYGEDFNGNPTTEFTYTVCTDLPDGGSQDIEYEMANPNDTNSPYSGGMIKKEIKTKDKLYKEVEAFINKSND